MWSVGVVAYSLLVGHHPFSMAMEQVDRSMVESQVLRLVAQGCYDELCVQWQALSADAKDFVSALLKVCAEARPSAHEALRHPYLQRRMELYTEVLLMPEPSLKRRARRTWQLLDGFQHLCWLAVARAVAEPELFEEVLATAAQSSRRRAAGSSAYIWHLARELCTLADGRWLRYRSAWPEVLRLAFSYIDLDGDGILSVEDIASHLAVGSEDPADRMNAWVAASAWVTHWSQQGNDSDVSIASPTCRGMQCLGTGLSPDNFHSALVTGPPKEAVLVNSCHSGVDSEVRRCSSGHSSDEEFLRLGLVDAPLDIHRMKHVHG